MRTKSLQILVTLIFLTLSVNLQAQIQQYSVMVGGSLTGTYFRGKEPANNAGAIPAFSNFTINASPRAGFFIFQQFAAGLGIEYNYFNKTGKNITPTKSKTTDVVVGPFVRYYFPNRIFTEGYFGVGIHNENDNVRSDILNATAGLGYALFINEKVALEPQLRYVYDSREFTNTRREKRHGVQFTIGLQIYLFHDKMVLYR